MMNHIVHYSLLFLLFFVINDAKKLNDPLQGSHPVCADVCTSPEAHVELDLSEPRVYREHEYVQIDLHPTGSGRCREPALLRIPLDRIGKHGILKFDLNFGPVLHNFSINIGFDDETNETKRSVNVFNQQVSIEYHSNKEHRMDIHEQSVTLLEPGEQLLIYLSNEWIHIENKQRNQQKLTIHFNESNFFFSHEKSSITHLFIGLNRHIHEKQTGIGLCSANLTFIECLTDQQSALDIDVNNKTFEQSDLENIHWISHLNYLDPNADVRECTAQGVIRLTFDSNGTRRIARFDMRMGAQIQGFTFNLGDSATNNGYGGDGGTTSNSAEIHSNDNRFYIWANTKICGDTLLLKIDYNVIEPYDNLTIFVSDERVELTNHRSYHQILRSPYLFALARQNVTCNCFDSLCYPGVQPDDYLYFGINRVIGGTYRPGTGVCHANVNWIQCKKIDVSPRIKHVPISTTTESTTTTAKVEEIAIISSTEPIETTTELLKHTDEIIITSTVSPTMIEESNQTNVNDPTSTFASTPSTMIYFEETTLANARNSTESIVDYTTINQAIDEDSTTTVSINHMEESSTGAIPSNQTRLFHLFATLTERPALEVSNRTISESTTITTSTTSSSSPCTLENLRANFVYHEYPLDKHKFIFCDSEGKMNIIACSPNYIWSQNEQSCILPN